MKVGIFIVLFAGLAVLPALAQESLDDLERRLEAAKKAEAARQAEARRVDATKATIVVKADGDCAFSVNGDGLGRLTANKTRTVKVNAGEQLIECEARDGRRVETTERMAAGEQKVLRLSLTGTVESSGSSGSSDGRFSRVADGVRDAQQGMIWAAADNGSDVDWSQARAYCAGKGGGWSLPTVAQLKSLHDATGQFGKTMTLLGIIGTIKPATSLIDLTGFSYWSSESSGSSEAWGVYLADGLRDSHDVSLSGLKRALCARRS